MSILPPVNGRAAFFFDFDGTLADLADHPESVQVDGAVPASLARLSRRCGGALAVVSGRPIADIDRHLGLSQLAVAGVHGAERRRADLTVERAPLPDLAGARDELAAWCARHPGLRLEVKPGALALHYRGADAMEDLCRAAAQRAHAGVPGTALLHGKKVIEIKPAAADKGRAVLAYMAEPPFTGRLPWCFGDDVTDEAAFGAVQSLGGVAVKVGEGDTTAAWRLPDPAALREWLLRVAATEAAP